MSTLAQDFNVGAVQGGHYQRMDVTLTWDSEIPMEFRLHMWQPSAGGEGTTVIWSVSRELLAKASEECIYDAAVFGMADVTAIRVEARALGISIIRLLLASDDGQIELSFHAEPLASFVRSSLAMCPTESEALDVDGLITQIFHAEEAQ